MHSWKSHALDQESRWPFFSKKDIIRVTRLIWFTGQWSQFGRHYMHWRRRLQINLRCWGRWVGDYNVPAGVHEPRDPSYFCALAWDKQICRASIPSSCQYLQKYCKWNAGYGLILFSKRLSLNHRSQWHNQQKRYDRRAICTGIHGWGRIRCWALEGKGSNRHLKSFHGAFRRHSKRGAYWASQDPVPSSSSTKRHNGYSGGSNQGVPGAQPQTAPGMPSKLQPTSGALSRDEICVREIAHKNTYKADLLILFAQLYS